MAVEIIMPRMGLTMEEGTVVEWLNAEGETVSRGDPLLEIETDKTVVVIESPGSGILGKILAGAGETRTVGEVIGYIVAEGESLPEMPAGATQEAPVELADAAEMDIQDSPVLAGKVKVSPAARRLAHEKNIDLGQVRGTGPGGRVVAQNVQDQLEKISQPSQSRATPVAKRVALELGVDIDIVSGTGPGGKIIKSDVEQTAAQRTDPGAKKAIAEARRTIAEAEKTIVAPSRAHQIMAQRMAESFSTVPHFYLHVEVNTRNLMALRQALISENGKEKVRITYTDLLVKLCGLALARHPLAMAQWMDGDIYHPEGVHIGIAVDSPAGLIVPVIREADKKGVAEIARHRNDLVERARIGKLQPQDLELGVFTISNLGIFAVDSFDAIVNPPQAAILAVGRIMERPVVENGSVVAAPTIKLSLSIDHRVLDGATASRFLEYLVALISNPGLALE
ncbi:MAG: 2-oxo acid dehydrogenase subunit E2 [Anaerolineales bacterium]|nr:2-oxo acid dehydrogenase subunit E2 [Anaerolineales bacterium]